MISSESSRQAHTQKRQNQYKKSKRGANYRKRGSGDQAAYNSNDNHDGRFDITTPEGSRMTDMNTGLIETCVQAIVRSSTQGERTLSETSSTTHDQFKRLLKNAREIKHGHKKDNLVYSTGAATTDINNNDLVDTIPVKETKGKNVFKTDQEISVNMARQERRLQRWQPPSTTEVLDEDTLELSRSTRSSNAPPWDQFAANEKLFGLKTDFDEELYTTKLDRSTDDFKVREQKAIALANEIERSSSNYAHVLEERGHISMDQTWDEEDRYGAVNKYSTNGNDDYNKNTGHQQSYKSSAKTYESRKSHRINNGQGRQSYQSNTRGQKDNQTTSPDTSGQISKESVKMNKTTTNIHHTKPTTKTDTVPPANRKNAHWMTDNSKTTHKRNDQNRRWTRNDMVANNNRNTATQPRRHNFKKDSSPASSNMESATKNENSPTPPAPSFKLNIMATEFIPFGGTHALYNEMKAKDMTSSISTASTASSSSAPQTPPSRNQGFVSVNEMLPAPFNKPGYLTPRNTEPLWTYGGTSYRNQGDFTSHSDLGFLMNEYQNLHQYFYGYYQFNLPHYPVHPYFPSYHQHQHQQYKSNTQNDRSTMHPAPVFSDNSMSVANQQPYPHVLHNRNYHQ